MPSDQQVTSKMILQTLQELTRTGTTPALEHLEQVEPDLASYLMETLTTIYHQILGLGGSAKTSRRVYRQVQLLALVCIVALRKGHYELWRRQADDSEEDSTDATPPEPPPP
jgi:hypothetical protein